MGCLKIDACVIFDMHRVRPPTYYFWVSKTQKGGGKMKEFLSRALPMLGKVGHACVIAATAGVEIMSFFDD